MRVGVLGAETKGSLSFFRNRLFADLVFCGIFQVVLTRADAGESGDDYLADFEISLQQK